MIFEPLPFEGRGTEEVFLVYSSNSRPFDSLRSLKAGSGRILFFSDGKSETCVRFQIRIFFLAPFSPSAAY